MADKAIFEIVVTDKGLKVNQKKVEDLGKAVEGTSKRTKEASKAQDELNYKLNQGTTGVSSAAKSFSKLNQAIGAGPNGLVGAYATLAANAFAISAAFNVLKEASRVTQVIQGLEIQGARLGVTLTNTAKSVKTLSGDMLSLADAMRATAQASAAGFGQKSIESLTQIARDASVALGRDVGDSLDRLIRGTTKLEPELLDELGIMVKLSEASSAYALQNGKTVSSLTSFEKRQGYLNAVIKEGTDKFAGIADQVKPDPYQKLASAFTDLIQKLLETANALGISTIVKALADNSYLLGAAMLYFASTISRSLLPGLYDLSRGIEVTASNLAYIASEKYKASVAAENLAKAEGRLALEQARTLEVTKGSANAYTAYVAAVRQGTASDEMRSKAVRSLSNSINYYSKQVSKLGDTEKGRAAQERLDAVTRQKDAILNLAKTEQAAEARTAAAIQLTTKARREAARVRMEAAAAGKAAEGIELIGQGNLKQGWDLVKQSIGSTFTVMRDRMKPENATAWSQAFLAGSKDVVASMRNMAATALTTSLSFLKMMVSPTAWFNGLKAGFAAVRAGLTGISISAITTEGVLATLRTAFLGAGAAAVTFGTLVKTGLSLILYGIPIIGQIVLLLQVLWEVGKWAWETFFPPSEAQKALEEAQKTLQETIDRVRETGKVTSEVFGDAYASVTSSAQAYKALSNTIVEVAENLKKVRAARAQLGQESAANAEEALANSFKSQVGRGLTSAVTDSEEFKSIAALTELGFAPLNEEIKKATVNSVEFQKASDERKIQLLADATERLSKKYASVGMAVEELNNSYKKLGDATQQFIQKATPSTAYDGLVEGLTSSSASMHSLKAEFERGTITIDDFNKHLTNIPTEAMGLLTQQTQAEVEKLQSLTGQIAAAQRQLDDPSVAGTARENVEAQITTLREQQLAQQRKLGPLLENDLDIQRKHMLSLQRQSVIAQGMLNIEKARLSTIQENLSKTGAGYLAQQEQEEKLREMAAAKIRAERAVLDILNLQAERKLQTAKDELEALKTRITNIEAGREELSLWQNILNVVSGISNTLLGTNLEIVSVEELRAQAEQVQATVIQLESETAKLGNAIEAANLEIAATLAENLTEAQKAARALSIDFENISKLGSIITDLFDGIAELSARRNQLSRAFSSDVMDGVAVSKAALDRQITSLNREIKARKDALSVQMQSVNSDLARAGITEAARQALLVRKSLLEEETRLLDRSLTIRTRTLEQTVALDLIERYRIDTMSNGLEIQQQALNLAERELDLKSGLVDQEKELRIARAKAIARDASGALNEEAQRSIEARAAREAYQLAADQYDLRIAAIEAEYALLTAQKIQLEYNLKAQRAVVDAQARVDGVIDANERKALNQLDNAIHEISIIDYTQLEEIAKRAERNTLELARQRAMAAESPVSGAFSGVAGGLLQGVIAFNNFASQQERRDIFAPIRDDVQRVHEVTLPNFEEATAAAEARLSEFTRSLSSINFATEDLSVAFDSLTTDFNSFLTRLREQGAIAQTAAGLGELPVSGVLNPGFTASTLEGGRYGAGREGSRTHGGQDYSAAEGSPLIAQLGGTLDILSQDVKSLGGISAALIVKDTEGQNLLRLGYAHLQSIDAAQGAFIRAGEQFAKTGSTGRTAGGGTYSPHLHYTVSYWDGNRWVAQDPTKPIDARIRTRLEDLSVGTLNVAEQDQRPSVVQAQATPATTTIPPEVVGQVVATTISQTTPEVARVAATAATTAAQEAVTQASTPSPTVANPAVQPAPAADAPTQADNAAGNIQVNAEKAKKSITAFSNLFSSTARPMIEELKTLGPDGEVFAAALAGMNGFVTQMNSSFAVMKMSAEDWKEATGKTMDATDMKMVKVAATMQMVSAAIGMVAQTLAASASARMASIDKEIAAEEKRDGKSAASVEKTNALAKKKDDIARKSFNVQKKLQLAQAVINTASAITMALATLPPPWGAIMAGVIGAMGLAQVALIASTNYESSYSPKTVQTPGSLSVGKRSDTVNLAMGPNANAGGELGYIRGAAGTGTNASNYNAIGSAYGGPMQRGYGNRGFVVGEKGPEVITPETPITVTPNNETQGSAPVNATINIQAIDSQGVQDVLVAQKGNIIQMLRQAANASGQRFLEDVNVNVYTRPNVGKLL